MTLSGNERLSFPRDSMAFLAHCPIRRRLTNNINMMITNAIATDTVIPTMIGKLS